MTLVAERRLSFEVDAPHLPGAACVGRDPELWMADLPGDNRNEAAKAEKAAKVEEAKSICWDCCPVRLECLELAVRTKSVGIWGGLTTRERQPNRRPR